MRKILLTISLSIWFTLPLSCALLIPAADAQSVAIPIQNPSFEQITVPLTSMSPCGPVERDVDNIPSWKFVVAPGSGGAGGLLQPNGADVVDVCNVPLAPDGKTIAFAQNTTISQTVQLPAQPVGVYVLKFWVANYFYWYAGRYTVSLGLTTVSDGPLCSNSGHPVGDFTQMTLTCPVRDYPAATMTVSLSSDNNWPTLFDNVSLTFTPEAP